MRTQSSKEFVETMTKMGMNYLGNDTMKEEDFFIIVDSIKDEEDRKLISDILPYIYRTAYNKGYKDSSNSWKKSFERLKKKINEKSEIGE